MTDHKTSTDSHFDLGQLSVASTLQANMLPKPLQQHRYTFDYLYKPKQFISGDMLDFWAVDDNVVLFYLADVAGHGIVSGMLSQWLKGLHGLFSKPLDLINHINDKLLSFGVSQHITLCVGLLNTSTSTLSFCNAGHFPPAIIIHSNQSFQLLESDQLPLGIMDDAGYQLTHIQLHQTDRLVICSDGALENYSGNGDDQLQSLINHLINQTFTLNSPLQDDVTLLYISPL